MDRRNDNRSLAERFGAMYEPEPLTGCWLWTGSTTGRGYGHMTYKQEHRYAHRTSYELFVGPIPDGLSVLHRCDTPPCVNPEHLFLGTQRDNLRDMAAKGRQWKQKLKRDRDDPGSSSRALGEGPRITKEAT